MKKLNLLIAAGILALSLAGCSNGTEVTGGAANNTTAADSTAAAENAAAADSTAAAGSTAAAENGTVAETTEKAESLEAAQTAVEPSSDSADTETESTEEEGTKALVVYFSATGNTKAAAETLAGIQGADLFEIVPEEPYTDEDLDYNDRSSRSTSEQNDANARPAISGTIDNIGSYNVVYIGYPIWWYNMPRIMYTFFDTYDFSGKTIVPFCTSGGSGLSGTPDTIAELEPEATVLEGIQLGSSEAHNAEAALSDWLTEIGLN